MSIGLVGRKRGMTRIFQEDGISIPVTVIEILPNHITQIKTIVNDGYTAVQVTTGKGKPSRVNKCQSGHYAKAKIELGRGLWEFRVENNDVASFELGQTIQLVHFSNGQKVDIIGQSKGHGFSGVIKRHNFSSQRQSHGNSLSHRAPGSIGQCQTPGRVFKGKRMAGRMGNTRVTIQNLEVIRVDKDKQVLLVKGAVPGANGNNVFVVPAVKAPQATGAA